MPIGGVASERGIFSVNRLLSLDFLFESDLSFSQEETLWRDLGNQGPFEDYGHLGYFGDSEYLEGFGRLDIFGRFVIYPVP